MNETGDTKRTRDEGQLPQQPSELLELALSDGRKTAGDDRYHPDAAAYHSPQAERGPCHVCLAGAVMAKSLGTDPREPARYKDFDGQTSDKLLALDQMRQSEWSRALQTLGVEPRRAQRTEELLQQGVHIVRRDFCGEWEFTKFLDSIEPAVDLLRANGL